MLEAGACLPKRGNVIKLKLILFQVFVDINSLVLFDGIGHVYI